MRKVVVAYQDARRERRLTDLPADQFPDAFMDEALLLQWARRQMIANGQLSAEDARTAHLVIEEGV